MLFQSIFQILSHHTFSFSPSISSNISAGNGGSAADSEHIMGELMKRFRLPRPVSDEYAKRLREVDGERGDILALQH